MINEYKNYFFDLGDTLIVTANLNSSFINTKNTNLSITQRKNISTKFNEYLTNAYERKIESQVDWKVLFKNIFDNLNITDINYEDSALKLLTNYTNSCILKAHTKELLQNLSNRGKNLYIISNVTGPSEIFNDQLKMNDIHHYFKNIFWSSSIGFRKPSYKFIEYVIENTKVNINESVLIGDSEVADVGVANLVNMDAILISEKRVKTNAKYQFSHKELYETICHGK